MSSYGKYMGFPVNFPQYGKMQQNPWYGKSLGNWYSYFSHSMGAFFPLDSHRMVYFSIWEMHGFPCTFPTVRENSTKPMVWGKSKKSITILFPWHGCFFPIRFTSYGILHHMGNAWVSPSISESMGKCNKTHRMGRTWEIGAHTFPILWAHFFH